MKYLQYLRDAAVKKIPLTDGTIVIGRAPDCDVCIDEKYVSNEHVRVTCFQHHIRVKNLSGTNPVYVNHLKVDEVNITLNESFCIGSLEFILREGNPEEFMMSAEIFPVILKRSKQYAVPREKTKTALNHFDEALNVFYAAGCRGNRFEEILGMAKEALSDIFKAGQLLILEKREGQPVIVSRLHLDNDTSFHMNPNDLDANIWSQQVDRNALAPGYFYDSFPIKLSQSPGVLLFIHQRRERLNKKELDFFKDFSKEVEFVYQLLEKNQPVGEDATDALPDIVYKDKYMHGLLARCRKIAGSDLSVLIQGETGTGKELLAKYIHYHSGRPVEKFIAVNCAAIPELLLEDELFGHVKGAFTDAASDRKGKLESSSGGTLVLDEIAEMSLPVQAKLLRVLEEKEFYKMGSDLPVRVDLRIISMTNKDLKQSVADKLFRNDLYQRITDDKIVIPPLRERKDDIVPLINYFLEMFSINKGIDINGLTNEAAQALYAYNWPGNVRQLQRLIKRLVELSYSGDIINFDLLNEEIKDHYNGLTGKGSMTEEMKREREQIELVLMECRWNVSKAAKTLGISRQTLYKKIEKHNIR